MVESGQTYAEVLAKSQLFGGFFRRSADISVSRLFSEGCFRESRFLRLVELSERIASCGRADCKSAPNCR